MGGHLLRESFYAVNDDNCDATAVVADAYQIYLDHIPELPAQKKVLKQKKNMHA